ncbi:hypothetical protein [Ruminococcus gauvreauii]|uniref:DUF4366 domain-containing protein n=1 Tax=Ruminococcus gauvreauii TaxID=438033 RepID=A0ABY5VDQ7_9FIRM|nr:hypothetical protein [Ruminococcus gauvreauii]UWP57996.1 hypothetical protein NQ502_11385 [Ruminococcus gauvreauii]
MNQRHVETHRKKRRLMALAMLALLLLLTLVGATIARYIRQQEQSAVAEPQDFYFTSDLLKEEEQGAVYEIDPQAETFTVVLYNFADIKRITSETLSYHVSVTGGTASSESGTLTGGAADSAQITVTPDKNAERITVTAIATKPYKKTLTAAFNPAAGDRYTVTDSKGNTAAVLTVTLTGTDAAQGITLILPDGVIPDATDDRVTANGSGYTYELQGKGVYSLVLLKSASDEDLTRGDTAFSGTIDLTAGNQ